MRQTGTGTHAFSAQIDGIFGAFRWLIARRARLLARLGVLGHSPEQAGLLREGALRDELLALQFLDTVLKLGNLGLVHFERCLCGTVVFGVLTADCGFFPPVSHMMMTIKRARPMRSHDWTFFGSRPGGLGAFPGSVRSWLASQFADTCREKVSFFLPTARYPLSRIFGAMYTPFSNWKLMRLGLPSFTSYRVGFSRAAHWM